MHTCRFPGGRPAPTPNEILLRSENIHAVPPHPHAPQPPGREAGGCGPAGDEEGNDSRHAPAGRGARWVLGGRLAPPPKAPYLDVVFFMDAALTPCAIAVGTSGSVSCVGITGPDIRPGATGAAGVPVAEASPFDTATADASIPAAPTMERTRYCPHKPA